MSRLFAFLSIALTFPAALQANEALTLDPALIEEAKQAVLGGAVSHVPTAPAAQPVEDTLYSRWCSAMCAAGTELAAVRLLNLLYELNSPVSPVADEARYAEVLQLHRLAAAGNKAALLELAAAFRTGAFANGLLFLSDETVAQRLLAGELPWLSAR